ARPRRARGLASDRRPARGLRGAPATVAPRRGGGGLPARRGLFASPLAPPPPRGRLPAAPASAFRRPAPRSLLPLAPPPPPPAPPAAARRSGSTICCCRG